MKPSQWRKMTWVLVAWSGLIFIWIIVGVINIASKNCADLVGSAFSGDSTCTNIEFNGKASVAGSFVVTRLLIWFVGLLVIAVHPVRNARWFRKICKAVRLRCGRSPGAGCVAAAGGLVRRLDA